MRLRFAITLALLAGLAGCGAPPLPAPEGGAVSLPPPGSHVEAAGLHNVYRVSDKLLSGSGPEAFCASLNTREKCKTAPRTCSWAWYSNRCIANWE